MFKIFDGRDSFYQWDLNQKLIIEDETIDEVHFSNRTDTSALVCRVYAEDGLRVVNVPNILLQNIWDIRAYGYCRKCYTKQYERFKVIARSKPADYIYTETEKITVEQLIAEGFEEAKAQGYFKGDKGDKGDTGAVKMIPVADFPTDNIDESAIYLKPIANWIGGSGAWIKGATTITTAGFNEVTTGINFFRIVLKKNDDSNFTIEEAENAIAFIANDNELITPRFSKGTIDNGTIHKGVNNRAYTTDLHFISKYKKVSLVAGWSMWGHFYNGDRFEEYLYIDGVWELIGGSGIEVSLDGYVKKTDRAGVDKLGLIQFKYQQGINIDANGYICISPASEAHIEAKNNYYAPIVPARLDKAVKIGVTTNTIQLSAAEKQAAQDWLGITELLGVIENGTY